MRVVPVPCLSDNYAYLVVADGSNECVVVDPSERDPVVRALDKEGLKLVGIVNTHHHPDHVGGNVGLVEWFEPMPVWAHDSDFGRIPGQTERVADKPLSILGTMWVPMHVPGHTLGAVAYVVEDAVFTGDTLFAAGCGRLFEGTAAQMHESLQKLARLPKSMEVYCGHEYTESNLLFAKHLEPKNEAVAAKLKRVKVMRANGEPTVPSTIKEELATNPFLRITEPTIREHYPAAIHDHEVFAAVRKEKDGFKAA